MLIGARGRALASALGPSLLLIHLNKLFVEPAHLLDSCRASKLRRLELIGGEAGGLQGRQEAGGLQGHAYVLICRHEVRTRQVLHKRRHTSRQADKQSDMTEPDAQTPASTSRMHLMQLRRIGWEAGS